MGLSRRERAALEASGGGGSAMRKLELYTVDEWLNDLKRGIRASAMEYRAMRTREKDDLVGRTWEAFKANLEKNRYPDVYCADDTRIVLSEDGPGNYIHASYVDGWRKEKEYICTQGPMADTVEDFWRMVWQEGTTVIVMLCNRMEQNKEKCAEYWPDEKGQRKFYGRFAIENHSGPLTKGENVLVTTLMAKRKVQEDGKDVVKRRKIAHVQYVGWPDMKVPKDTTPILDVIKAMNHARNALGEPGPPVIHCSAGIGRTGTLVALEVNIMSYDEIQKINPREVVNLLRKQRLHSVQTEFQYLFVFRALFDYLTAKGALPTPPPDTIATFITTYNRICAITQ